MLVNFVDPMDPLFGSIGSIVDPSWIQRIQLIHTNIFSRSIGPGGSTDGSNGIHSKSLDPLKWVQWIHQVELPFPVDPWVRHGSTGFNGSSGSFVPLEPVDPVEPLDPLNGSNDSAI